METARPSRREKTRHSVRAALHGGNITSDQLRRLDKLIEGHVLTLRITPDQDLLIRDFPPKQLSQIQAALLDRIGVEPFAAVMQRHEKSGDLRELTSDVGEQTPCRAQGKLPATTC